jgi:hypothetical protein
MLSRILTLPTFLILAIQIGMQQDAIMVFCTSLIPNNTVYLLVYIFLLFQETSLLSSCPLSNWILVILLLSLHILRSKSFTRNVVCQYFLLICCLYFIPLMGSFTDQVCLIFLSVFNFDEVQFIHFFLLWIIVLALCQKILHQANTPKSFLKTFQILSP